MTAFRTVYSSQPLPGGGDVMYYDVLGDITQIFYEPALLEDPRGVLERSTAHGNANAKGYLALLPLLAG